MSAFFIRQSKLGKQTAVTVQFGQIFAVHAEHTVAVTADVLDLIALTVVICGDYFTYLRGMTEFFIGCKFNIR